MFFSRPILAKFVYFAPKIGQKCLNLLVVLTLERVVVNLAGHKNRTPLKNIILMMEKRMWIPSRPVSVAVLFLFSAEIKKYDDHYYFLYAPHMRREHHNVVSDASPSL
jgi:hypothetical protein